MRVRRCVAGAREFAAGAAVRNEPARPCRILGVESTCDESGVALIEGRRIVSERLASQWQLTREYGGVFPTMSARQHAANLPRLYLDMLDTMKVDRNDQLRLDAVAVAAGPGLSPCLDVGLRFAKGICEAHSVPLVAVNHLEAHVLVSHLVDDELAFPYLALIVSGGHTQLLYCKGVGRYDILGTTHDDAIGEAFDKVARVLQIEPQPGDSYGRALERCASSCRSPATIAFPVAMSRRTDCDFSYSGLKAAVKRVVEAEGDQVLSDEKRAAIAAAFQEAAVSQVASRLRRALQGHVDPATATTIVLGGGVASNQAIQRCVRQVADQHRLRVVCPPATLCSDSAVSIAYAGALKFALGHCDPLTVGYSPRWPLGSQVSRSQPHVNESPCI
ncbi:N(6)-L-threonylcarbamoyladenine synthase [Plasmodiophora brassicae]|uniref:N(6)-L-threonylcarbamoyladenine synthase n=1 Tax=Plasmodiophora brassicae TaxID=37360 RepID=A0A0G4IW59_PLABS|nr:hypothetical protein PBRA_001383 [Plasmodiophora brassicae]SPQ97484.1 unnamed protein product [Plasmodiophora brassicae]